MSTQLNNFEIFNSLTHLKKLFTLTTPKPTKVSATASNRKCDEKCLKTVQKQFFRNYANNFSLSGHTTVPANGKKKFLSIALQFHAC